MDSVLNRVDTRKQLKTAQVDGWMVCSVFVSASRFSPPLRCTRWERSVGSCRLLKPLYTILKKMDSPLIKDNLTHIVAWNRADLSRSRQYQCKEIHRIYH